MNHRRWIAIAIAAALAVTVSACNGGTSSNSSKRPPLVFPAVKEAPDNVAVLVVDDFVDGGKDALTNSALTNNNCTVSTNEVNTNGAGSGDLGGDTHGAVVYRVLQQQLDGIIGHANRLPSPPATDPKAVRGSYTDWKVTGPDGPATMRLIAVDIPGYTTASAIQEVSDTVKALNGSFKRFVLNLSFVTIPCDPTQFFDSDNQDELFTWYTTTVAGDLDLQKAMKNKDGFPVTKDTIKNTLRFVLTDATFTKLRSCLVNEVYKQVDKELAAPSPLENGRMTSAMLKGDMGWNPDATNHVITIPGALTLPVGAAGNGVSCEAVKDASGQPIHKSFAFPFAPALWDFVVSASAEDSSGNKAGYANGGEVRVDDSHPDFALNSRGSSYSAARLSAAEAMYLLNSGTVTCRADQPPLGYITHATDTMPAAPTPPPWKNEPHNNWPTYCPSFNPYLP